MQLLGEDLTVLLRNGFEALLYEISSKTDDILQRNLRRDVKHQYRHGSLALVGGKIYELRVCFYRVFV